ncbi:uncharacterized protein J3D65DRAFT_602205 [Phyllosticta citribraziliensis]|uniref:Uncharacterized protein n=1 Tax=Phyllosticta citribraziliensis TaxID=989973 RepID=A0ABR1LU08_9PEZI
MSTNTTHSTSTSSNIRIHSNSSATTTTANSDGFINSLSKQSPTGESALDLEENLNLASSVPRYPTLRVSRHVETRSCFDLKLTWLSISSAGRSTPQRENSLVPPSRGNPSLCDSLLNIMSPPEQFANAETSKTSEEKAPEMEHTDSAEKDMEELRTMLAKYGVELPEDDDDATVMDDQDFEKLDQFYEDCFDMSAGIEGPCEEEPDDIEDFKKPGLSPSLKPEKCATAPEICYWASSTQLKQEYRQLRATLVYDNDLSDDAVRRFATINTAYKRSWYPIPAGECLMYPDGATGKKRPLPKLPRGCKGLKEPWDDDIPTNDYVPMGVSRKRENRPARGRWFFPQQSGLRYEVKSE